MEKILIVEDQVIIALELQSRVTNFGYEVVGTADRGITAINKTRELKPDLILMDIHLKGDIDGIEATREIQKSFEVPIIYISAYSDKATRDRIKESNAHGLLYKPFSDKELQAAIELALYKFSMEQMVKQREEALRESEEKFKTITQSLLDIIFIIDKKGNQVYFNDRLKDILGYEPDEIIGTRFTRIIPPNELPKLIEQVRLIFSQNVPSTFTTQMYHKNGSIIDVEINGRLIEYLGEQTIQGTIRDISEKKRIEEALRKSEQLYKTLIDTLPDSVTVTDSTGNIKFVSNRAIDVYGEFSMDDIVGKSILNWVAVSDQQKVIRNFERLVTTGTLADNHFKLMKKDGTEFFGEINASIVKEKNNEVDNAIIVTRDITHKKQIEDAILQSERHYKGLVENINQGYYTANKYSIFKYCNPAISLVSGYTNEELLNKSAFRLVDESDRPRVINAYKEWTASGLKEVSIEFKSRTKDGRILDVEQITNIMRDEEGNVNEFRCFLIDITKRKKLEMALSESEQNYFQIINGMLDAVYVIDWNGKFLDVNDSALKTLGYTKEEMLTMGPSDIDVQLTDDYINQLIKDIPTDKVQIFQTTHKTKNNILIPIEIVSSTINYKGGKAILSIARDISERREAAKEIKKQNKLLEKMNADKDKFFSIIAHDLQSPLHGLIGMSDLMSGNLNDFSTEELQNISKEINKSTTNIYNLVRNLLEWARIQKDNYKIDTDEYSLNSIINNSIEQLAQAANLKNIKIANQLSDDFTVIVDDRAIQSVIINLLSNAIKFCRNNGQIKITAKKADMNQVLVSIADNGIGMSNDFITKIFKIEEKVGRVGTAGEPTTGLGLLLCKEFIAKHKGKIWVESKENVGSTFYFTLPLKN